MYNTPSIHYGDSIIKKEEEQEQEQIKKANEEIAAYIYRTRVA